MMAHTRSGRWGRAPARGGGGLFQTRSVFGSVSTRRPAGAAGSLAHRTNRPSLAEKHQLPATMGWIMENFDQNSKWVGFNGMVWHFVVLLFCLLFYSYRTAQR